jgi:4-hydroxy-tetrahydrodipicolinate synthase
MNPSQPPRPSPELWGILPIVATPFDPQGGLDEPSLRRLVNYLIRVGAHGLAPLGGSGECQDLTVAERQRLTDIVLEENNGRVPVMVGTSAPDTATCVELSRYAERAGAQAVFAQPPFDAPPDEAHQFAHYAALNEALNIPIVVHTTPEMAPAFVARLGRELEGVQYVKEETSPTGGKITRLLEASEGRLRILSGGGAFLTELARGVVGVVPGSCGVASYVRAFERWQAGDRAAARAEYHRVLPLVAWRARCPLEATKEFLCRLGIFRTTTVRRQAGQSLLDDYDRAELTAILEAMGEPV